MSGTHSLEYRLEQFLEEHWRRHGVECSDPDCDCECHEGDDRQNETLARLLAAEFGKTGAIA